MRASRGKFADQPVADSVEMLVADGIASAAPDPAELRRILVAVRALEKHGAEAGPKWLWEPVTPGGPLWVDHCQSLLVDALRAQVTPSIRRLKASKPLPYRMRKIVTALLTLGDLDHKLSA